MTQNNEQDLLNVLICFKLRRLVELLTDDEESAAEMQGWRDAICYSEVDLEEVFYVAIRGNVWSVVRRHRNEQKIAKAADELCETLRDAIAVVKA